MLKLLQYENVLNAGESCMRNYGLDGLKHRFQNTFFILQYLKYYNNYVNINFAYNITKKA